MSECFPDELVELHKGTKDDHIRSLQEATGIAYSDMVMFDDEREKNLVRVDHELPAVKTYHVPDGMTIDAWEAAKRELGMP